MTDMDERFDNSAQIGNDALIPSSAISSTAMAVLAASMARGSSRIIHAAFDPAVRALVNGLRQLGVATLVDEPAGRIDVTGQGGHWGHGDIELDCEHQSLTTHFLLAASVLGRSCYRLMNPATETASLSSLIDALTDLGAQIHIDRDARDPVIQVGPAPFRGGRTAVRDIQSSIATASLLLVVPCAAGDVFLEIPAWPARPPEVSIALQILEDCDIAVIDDRGTRMIVPAPQSYAACEHDISTRMIVS